MLLICNGCSKKYFISFCVFVFWGVIALAQSSDLHRPYNDEIKRLITKERYLRLSVEENLVLARAYSKVNKPFLSLFVLNKLIPNLIEEKDVLNLSKAYNIKAENLVDLNKVEEGVTFCANAMPLVKKNTKILYQEFCVKCGILFDENKQSQKALTLFDNVKDERIKQLPVYVNNYGVILMNLAKHNQALEYLKRGVYLSKKSNRQSSLNVGYTNIAKVLIAKKKWEEAKVYLDSASQALDKSDKVDHKKVWLKTYYDFFKYQKKYVKTKSVLKEIRDYNNLVYDARVQQKIKELSVVNKRKTELNKKVVSIDNEIKNTKKLKLTRYILLIILIMLMSSWAFLYRFKNIKQKYNKIQNEQELLTSQMTPHFIFNSLSILQGMVLNNEHQKASLYLSKFSNILKYVIHDESQKFIPVKEELIGLKDYVDLQNLSAKKDVSFEIYIEKTLENKLLIPPMVLQPFIENAIIHGFKETIKSPTIVMSFTIDDMMLLCTVEDNGVGYKPKTNRSSKSKTSLALKIIQDRFDILSKRMNRKYTIEIIDLQSDNKSGTQVRLHLPYKFNL